MNACSNLAFLTMLACELSECLTQDELSILGANLTVLGDMLSTIVVQQEICDKNKDNENSENCSATTLS